MTSKQRAYLRGIANPIKTTQQVGKGGEDDNMIKQVDDALEARELIKVRVLENSLMSAREAAEEIAEAAGCEVVQTIGTRFVLYKESRTLPPEKRIVLPK